MIKGQFAKNLHKAVSERGIKQVELAKVLRCWRYRLLQ